MALHNTLGKEGEMEAAAFLQSDGYYIHERNWHFGKLELDIIAEKDGELVFVEVKTRRNNLYGNPVSAITDKKIRHILSSANAYLKYKRINLPCRYDVITIVGTRPPFQIEHIKNAFYPHYVSYEY